MNAATSISSTPARSGIHPLMAIAAVSVTVLSAVGVGAMTGLIPTAKSTPAPAAMVAMVPAPVPVVAPVAAAVAPVALAAAPVAVAPAPVERIVERIVEKPVIKYVERKPAPVAPVARAPEPVYAPAPQYPAPQARVEPVQVASNQPIPVYGQPGYGSTPSPMAQQAPRPAINPNMGVVESVTEQSNPGEASGVGAVAGAIGGAVLGNQVGKGNGKKVATVIGGVAGGFGGHQVEKMMKTSKTYEIRVRMEDGSYRTVTQSTAPSFRSGDKVRVEGNTVSNA